MKLTDLGLSEADKKVTDAQYMAQFRPLLGLSDVESSTGKYLVVVGGEEVPTELDELFPGALQVRRCPGEPKVSCPVLRGQPCMLRRESECGVIYLAGEHEFFNSDRWQCVTEGSSPAVAVLDGSTHQVRGRDGFAVVGSELGPEGVAKALSALDVDLEPFR